MEKRRRVLFTNNTLAEPAGTELSLHDAALGLKARGHEVAAFSLQHGTIAQRLAAAGVPVVENLQRMPWSPDIIHGHHQWETTIAALRWPAVPVVSFCRGPYLWQEAPCRAPNVAIYAAVDEECRRRLVEKEGIPAEKVELVLNGVDLDRFRPRPALPEKPKQALIFSNYASEDNFVPVVRTACQTAGIELTVIGRGTGNPCSQPQDMLGSFDVVFAKGKAALESLAVGCALIVADAAGLGPMVTRENLSAMRRPCHDGIVLG
jgi:glycosyltransferase involved in cell wall biosynthesis